MIEASLTVGWWEEKVDVEEIAECKDQVTKPSVVTSSQHGAHYNTELVPRNRIILLGFTP